MSLYSDDYRSGERTFQLLTQAAGRAGRGRRPGEVIIQTYSPDHYSIRMAARQDYEGFYEKEMNYRDLMGYPPASQLMAVLMTGSEEICNPGKRRWRSAGDRTGKSVGWKSQ